MASPVEISRLGMPLINATLYLNNVFMTGSMNMIGIFGLSNEPKRRVRK